MRELEQQAFARGVSPERLMEKAGRGMANALLRRYPVAGWAVACIGTGNNGGDALVVLRCLADAGWCVAVHSLHPAEKLAPLPRKKWDELGGASESAWSEELAQEISPRRSGRPLIVLDGLLGIGASGPLRAPLDELAEWMNVMRLNHGADVIAMDIPSGLHGDTGEAYDGAVVADLTLTVGVPKVGLLVPEAASFTGAVESIPLVELPIPDGGPIRLIDAPALADVLHRRPHEFHKGNAGRVGILAGSRGMLGAAVLCALGAMRSGAGLVTVFVVDEIYPMLVAMMPPEVMVHPVGSWDDVLDFFFGGSGVLPDALAMGPGMGSADSLENQQWLEFLTRLERKSGGKIPILFDADALNRLAGTASPETYLKAHHIVTPHPGEMARLFPEGAQMDRLEQARAFVDRYPGVTLLLKGAHSIVTRSGEPLHINGSGHAGMACGGQGDVLTGVLVGLLAQGVEAVDAARLGAWLCGRAAELAVSHGDQSIHSLSAGDVVDFLGRAFREL
jgi:NAD(P)H-hydrate epimerase